MRVRAAIASWSIAGAAAGVCAWAAGTRTARLNASAIPVSLSVFIDDVSSSYSVSLPYQASPASPDTGSARHLFVADASICFLTLSRLKEPAVWLGG